MTNKFFTEPILNSPYEEPRRHWELNKEGQPTQKIADSRRLADFYTSAIPAPQKFKGKAAEPVQTPDLGLFQDETARAISTEDEKYELASAINALRNLVTEWRNKDYKGYGITPETERLLKHWRYHGFSGVKPFFCQTEAVEIAIWLTEVAPKTERGKQLIKYLGKANNKHNPGLNRLALKLATGAGKTTVMAMLIAWQAINAARHPRGCGHEIEKVI